MGLLTSLDRGNYVILAIDGNDDKRRWAVDTIAQASAITDELKRTGGITIELFGPDGLRFWTWRG
jgi:hypothetical protein